MSAALGPEVRALLEARNMAHVGTAMPDGAPQASPVWIALEGDRLAIYCGPASVKARRRAAASRSRSSTR